MPADLGVTGAGSTAKSGSGSPGLATPKPIGACVLLMGMDRAGDVPTAPSVRPSRIRCWPGPIQTANCMSRESSRASHDPPRRVPKDWQLLVRYHPPGWHLEFNPRRFSPDGSSRSATCDATDCESPDGTALASDHAGRKASRPSGVLEEAAMDWMSAISVAVLTVLAAEAMGALFTRG
jgi:hypothetical protein